MQSLPFKCAAVRTASLSFLIATVTSVAHADDPQGAVRLSLDACPTLAAARVRNILGAEIGSLLMPADADTATPATEVVVACDGTNTTLTVRDPATDSSITREVALDVVHPLARERLVAIAIAELITAIGIEIEPAVPVVPEPIPEPPPEPTPEPVEVPTPHARRFQISVLGDVSVLRHPRRGVYGASVRFDHRPHPRLGWSASFRVDHSRVGTELGRVLVAQVGVALEGTASIERGIVTLQPAVGGQLSLAYFHGDALADSAFIERTLFAPVFAPHVALRAFIRPTKAFFVVLGAEASYYTLRAHALVDGFRAVSLQGPALRTELGAGLAF